MYKIISYYKLIMWKAVKIRCAQIHKSTEVKTETHLNKLSHFKFSTSSSLFMKWVYAPSICKAAKLYVVDL